MRGSIAFALLLLSACAVSRATINSYTHPTFDGTGITTLAVFPMRNASFAPSEARQVTRQVTMALANKSPNVTILGAAEAVGKLNDRELADEWATFLENYAISGVADSRLLNQVNEALGVDAILQGEIVNVYQQDGAFGSNKGTTRVTVRFTLLNCHDGDLLWEATSDGIKTTGTTLESAPPIVDAVQLAVDKIVANMPRIGPVN